MSNYKFYKLKDLSKLPDDVNSYYENIALNVYHSKNLLAGLKDIKKNRTYTGKEPGAMLINTRLFKILCYVEAHSGVIMNWKINKFVVAKKISEKFAGMWNDDETEFTIPDSRRNPYVDFFVPKEEKQKTKAKKEINQVTQ